MLSIPVGGSPGTASMKRYLPLLGLVTLAALLAIALLLAQPGEAQTITVDDDGPADYDNLQDAIDNVTSGDTIFISEGYYGESISMNSYQPDDITITGESQENIYIFRLKLRGKANVSIDNLTLDRLSIFSSNNISVKNLFVNYIPVQFSNNISIHHSSIERISIKGNNNILIDNNNITSFISLESSENVTISNSDFFYNDNINFDNGCSIFTYRTYSGSCKNCIVENNLFTFHNKSSGTYPEIYAIKANHFINVSIVNNVFVSYNISIFFESQSWINIISNNSFQHNDIGIKFDHSGNSIIDGNTFIDTDIAIWTNTKQKRIENNTYIDVKDEYYEYEDPNISYGIQSGFNTPLTVVTIFLITALIVRRSRRRRW